jgi:PAS domain-containing protein
MAWLLIDCPARQPRPASLGMIHMVKPAGNERAARRPGQALATGTPPQRAVIEMTGTGIVSSWNPAAVLLYGYPAEEIVGHPADVLCPPEGRAGEAAVLQRIIAGGAGGAVRSRPGAQGRDADQGVADCSFGH